MTTLKSRAWKTRTASVLLLAFAGTASAGLPMTCHQLDAGNAALLPWGEGGWRSLDRSYDIRKLAGDMQRLLAGDAPMLARMENIRRAAMYALERPAEADELLHATIARAAAGGPRHRLAWFDAAYLIETFRQAGMTMEKDLLGRKARPATPYPDLNALDGYRMLGALLEREGPSAEIEFARGLMMRDGMEQQHLKRAAQMAAPKSQLARNVAKFLY